MRSLAILSIVAVLTACGNSGHEAATSHPVSQAASAPKPAVAAAPVALTAKPLTGAGETARAEFEELARKVVTAGAKMPVAERAKLVAQMREQVVAMSATTDAFTAGSAVSDIWAKVASTPEALARRDEFYKALTPVPTAPAAPTAASVATAPVVSR